jgi:hypothetical protein
MRAVVVVALLAGLGACQSAPPANELSVFGKLERDGFDGVAQDVAISYGSKNARGEWWNCELRMTATACVGDHHVNAWIAMPNVQSLDKLGGTSCIGTDGKPFGAFEELTQKLGAGEPAQVPGDVQVLFLVASDKNGDGIANLADDKETVAASRLLNGTVEVKELGSFNDPVALTISGLTSLDSLQVNLDMNGPTQPVPNPPTLEPPSSCVASDAVSPPG